MTTIPRHRNQCKDGGGHTEEDGQRLPTNMSRWHLKTLRTLHWASGHESWRISLEKAIPDFSRSYWKIDVISFTHLKCTAQCFSVCLQMIQSLFLSLSKIPLISLLVFIPFKFHPHGSKQP